MKSNARSNFYFSAYPLKAVSDDNAGKPSTELPSYLKAILSSKTRTLSRVRVFPLVNPYRETSIPVTPETSKVPNDIELTEKEWFNNYE